MGQTYFMSSWTIPSGPGDLPLFNCFIMLFISHFNFFGSSIVIITYWYVLNQKFLIIILPWSIRYILFCIFFFAHCSQWLDHSPSLDSYGPSYVLFSIYMWLFPLFFLPLETLVLTSLFFSQYFRKSPRFFIFIHFLCSCFFCSMSVFIFASMLSLYMGSRLSVLPIASFTTCIMLFFICV